MQEMPGEERPKGAGRPAAGAIKPEKEAEAAFPEGEDAGVFGQVRKEQTEPDGERGSQMQKRGAQEGAAQGLCHFRSPFFCAF